jgi:hypothetical protein
VVIQNHWDQEFSLDWDAEYMRIRCIGHIINLVVQAFLFSGVVKIEEFESYDEQKQEKGTEATDDKPIKIQFRLLGSFDKGHNIVVFIRKSAERTVEFKELAGKMVPMDNRTRWNSWYEIFTVLLEIRLAIEKYCQDHEDELEEDILFY